jgi:hypothetical protein
MWIYTSTGMVSIVQHNKKQNVLLVRARTEQHLNEFITTIPEITPAPFYLVDADYKHRAEINKIEVQRLVIKQLERIDYFDFKGSIETTMHDYYSACYTAWSAMNETFKNG